MPHEVQTVVATPLPRLLAYPGNRPPWAPKAQCIFMAEDVAVDAIGTGDTGAFILQFPLPTNNIYVLQRLMLSHRGSSANPVSSWDKPMFTQWFGLPDKPVSEAVRIGMAMSNARVTPPNATQTVDGYYTYGGGDRENAVSPTGSDQINPAFVNTLALVGGYPDANSPQFSMTEPDADVIATTISYVCIFNQYDVNASLESVFHANQPLGQPG